MIIKRDPVNEAAVANMAIFMLIVVVVVVAEDEEEAEKMEDLVTTTIDIATNSIALKVEVIEA